MTTARRGIASEPRIPIKPPSRDRRGSSYGLGNLRQIVNPPCLPTASDLIGSYLDLGAKMRTGILVERLVAAGIPLSEASEIITAAFAAGMASAGPQKSTGATRQQRYRDRQKTVTNRNENVTPLRSLTNSDTVTKRNESVTERNDVTGGNYTLSSTSIDSKKERLPRRKSRSAIPPDFQITPPMREFSTSRGWPPPKVDRQFEKFKSHHQGRGTLAADWPATWRTWVLNDYDSPREANGQASMYVDGRL